jgi:peptidyl-prolyl cis-trans isomerase D
MAVLEKIRVKFGLGASIIIALGLLSFIIDPSEVASAFQSMSSKNDVGSINGHSVSYVDFQEQVENLTDINEALTGSSAQSADQQKQIRNMAWTEDLYKYLFIKRAKAAGINVGKDEMVDLTTGENISPIIAQIFTGEDGNVADNVRAFVQNLSSDQTGRMQSVWNYLQNSVYNQAFFDKYATLFEASNFENPLMLKKSIEENNNTTDVSFVMVPYGYQQDTSIVVAENEIKSYYDSHKSLFRQQASRDMEYVVFEVTPSQSDIDATKAQIADVMDEFASADNSKIKNFILKNSDRPYSEYWNKPGDLKTVSTDIDNFVWSGAEGVSEIFTKDNNFYAARVIATKSIPDSVYVRHILFQGDNADSQADSVLAVLKSGSESFSNLATQYSADTQSAADGERGNLGWLTQNYMFPGMESVLEAKVNDPYILHTQYGTHIVEVTKTTDPILKKQVAILEKDSQPSKDTYNSIYAQANRFSSIAGHKYETYKAAVDSLHVYSHPYNNMLMSTDQLGSIEDAKEVTRWVFDNKPGKVSDIITVNNNYFVIAAVTGVHKEGIATLAEVSPQIRERLYYEKLGDKAGKEVAEKIKGLDDLQVIADTLNSAVSTQSGVTFANMGASQLDPKFIGALSVAPEGKICGPLVGSVGIYVYQVNGRDTGAFYTEDDAKARKAQENQYLSQMIIPVMSQDEVKYNMDRFY